MKKIEKKQREWDKRNEILRGKRSKQKGNGKNMKQTDFTGKKRNDYKKGKQGDTQKEKETKETKKKRPNKKKLKKNEKWWKRRR